tara:strand:+ start:28 stop:744 length:717 start_codon:yes stop_codon:yes gene_type:complete
MSNIVDVCLSPDLIHLFSLKNKVVVVIDIFRASSVICTALNNGITEVIPISDLGQLNEFDSNNFLIAAERDGKIVEGFKFGNSPLHYHENPDILGKKLVLTTTNGTRAINLSKNEAESVIIASFLNITAVSNFLKKQQKDILVLCSGWKGKISLEDTLFAGFILEKLIKLGFKSESDSSFLSRQLYNDSRTNLIKFALQSSHKKRTENLGIDKDLKFCLQLDIFDNVPIFKEGGIVLL